MIPLVLLIHAQYLSGSSLHKAQHVFRDALCDSFNTPKALAQVKSLVFLVNVYLERGRSNVNISVVKNIGIWVSKMLRMFGLGEGPPPANGIGWGIASSSPDAEESIDVSGILSWSNLLSGLKPP